MTRLLAPEVVQTSAMDCGPAALKSLLAGHGLNVSYGRLREACQTGVDGTSIDDLETVANDLGLDAEQVLIPVDHVLRPTMRALPAIAVVIEPGGLTHFVVVWRTLGPFVQLMDPAVGRRWVHRDDFLRSLYRHTTDVPAAAWREWADTPEARHTFEARLDALSASALLAPAYADPTPTRLARLDAALRQVERLVEARALRPGAMTRQALERLLEADLPDSVHSVRPTDPDGDGTPQLSATGAVLISVHGLKPRSDALSEDLALAISEPPLSPLRAALNILREDGWGGPLALFLSLLLASLGVLFEGLVFRGLLDSDRLFGTPTGHLLGWGSAIGLILGLGLLEWHHERIHRRMGRRLETRLRVAFHAQIPRLGDRYFQSRPISDLAERAHALAAVRTLPTLSSRIVQSTAALLAITAGLLWLAPTALPVVLSAVTLALLLPLFAHPAMAERDLKRRTHTGSLFRLTLDAMAGLVAIRSHVAERLIEREHEALLSRWLRAGRSALRIAVGVEVLEALIGASLAVFLVLHHLDRDGGMGSLLLLTWWALEVPALALQLTLAIRQYPQLRNVLLRVLEVTERLIPIPEPTPLPPGPLSLRFDKVSVVANGHTLISDLNLAIDKGQHLAIVGPSGAGKSTLLGLLLGWHRPANGRVEVSGTPMDDGLLETLRPRLAWVDPEVALWNNSLLDNLRYGPEAPPSPDTLARAVSRATLDEVLIRLPEGLQTLLGEGGGLLSAGEGQRVRLARAFCRPSPSLVLLDEATRGLDREARRALLDATREWAKDATLLCVTHDLDLASTFDRVLVIDEGRLVEDGAPEALLSQDSLFARLSNADRAVNTTLWTSPDWRRLHLTEGKLREVR
jgi:ABC-type bacteriocin/lantibiotic exporter with double-glycine peptidase domain